jgi:asparagine synthase (glutamine-hydrolysing)
LAHREIIPMPTFSVVHEKSAGSFSTEDGHYSRLAVRKFGNSTDHHEITVSIGILEELDEMIGQMDQPVGDSATLPTWYLSRFANNRVKTVLSGAGADELFAGYNRHQAYHHYLGHYNKYKKSMGFLKSIGKLLPTGIDHPYRKKSRLIKKFLMDLDKNPSQTFQNFVSMGFPIPREPLVESENKDSHQLFGNALQQDLHGYLISDVLTVNDRMAMAHGLEMRMPYLDGVLFDFIQSIDPVQLIGNGQKWILKTILSRMGGHEFCKRPKEGFGLPFGHWIRRNEFGMGAVFNEKQEIINKFVGLDQVRKMYGDHMRLKSDHTTELWAYLILAKWLKLHGFDGQ